MHEAWSCAYIIPISASAESANMGKSDAAPAAVIEYSQEEPGSSNGHNNTQSTSTNDSNAETSSVDGLVQSLSRMSSTAQPTYKVYKRRFFGLFQLVLLNIVVSWTWITFAPISTTSAHFFDVSESTINWLSTAFLFAFVVATPFTFYTLAKHGPKTSIVISSILLLLGNWIRYGGARSRSFAAVMVGQLVAGFAQPFVLAAPSTYSNLWFSAAGRTTSTAVASLANPLGAALGQLISPFWATDEANIPNAVLYIAIIASVAAVPSFVIPAKPPTPPAPSIPRQSERNGLHAIKADSKSLLRSVEFYLIFIAFSVYVGAFNAVSTLLNQILAPYGFTEDEAGIAGAVLIFVGLLSAAISSPIVDKYKCYLLYIKVSIPLISLCYLLFIWAPQSRSLAFVCVLTGINGAASFGLLPVVLEYLIEIHYPVGIELGSSLCWCGGQLLGVIFIIIMDQLKISANNHASRPAGDMYRSLIFQAVIALVAMPLPLSLGLFGRQDKIRRKRWEIETRLHASEVDYSDDGETHTQSQTVSPVDNTVRYFDSPRI